MDSNDELKKIDIKNRACYYFDDIIKTEDFSLHNISIDEKLYENKCLFIAFYKKLWLMLNLCVLGSIKQIDTLKVMIELDILHYLEVKYMI